MAKNTEHDKIAVRLTQILLKLNQGDKLDPRELAQEFQVTLRTIQRDLLERFAYLPLKKENNLFQIIITDSAGGISKENKAKIFEPYFTTKHQSSGKGLSLALTYKVITEYHDGKIEVQNEEFIYENKNLSGVSFIFTFKTDE